MEWLSIESAPKDGTFIQARRKLHSGGFETHRKTYWDNGWIYKLFGKHAYCWGPTEWRVNHNRKASNTPNIE